MLEYIILRSAFHARPIKLIAFIMGAVLLCAGIYHGAVSNAAARGTSKTIALYNVHTKEKLEITFKRNGRFDQAALGKINHFMRDWRAQRTIQMDPSLIDLLWELHEELGSKKPIHLISGFRSTKTNIMLRRKGRRTARHSMHIQGRATDVFFPDVPVKRLRESALLRERGGVGYYPRSGKHGFVHIDTGSVRHWPRMNPVRYAALMKRRKTRRKPAILVARHVPRPPQRSSFTLASGPTSLSPALGIPVPRQKPTQALAALEPGKTPILPQVPRPRTRPVFTAAAEPVITPFSARTQVITASLNPSSIFTTAAVRARTVNTRNATAQRRGLMIATAGVKGLRGTMLPRQAKAGQGVVINRARKGNLLMSLHNWTAPRLTPARRAQTTPPAARKTPQPNIKISSLN